MSGTSNTQPSSTAQNQELKSTFGFKLWERLVQSITALGLVFGGLWTFWTYTEDRRHEDRLALYKEQKERYYPLAMASAEIVTARSLVAARPAIKAFQTLYYGEGIISADPEFTEAAKDFLDAISEFETGPEDGTPSPGLIQRQGVLAESIKQSLDLKTVFGLKEDPKKTSSAAGEATLGVGKAVGTDSQPK